MPRGGRPTEDTRLVSAQRVVASPRPGGGVLVVECHGRSVVFLALFFGIVFLCALGLLVGLVLVDVLSA
jgi:hypothetical protein